jgi:hypothetical protein
VDSVGKASFSVTKLVGYQAGSLSYRMACLACMGDVGDILQSGNSYRRGRHSTVDLHIKIGCFVKKGKIAFFLKSG